MTYALSMSACSSIQIRTIKLGLYHARNFIRPSTEHGHGELAVDTSDVTKTKHAGL
jgi:hypothetical protein